MAEPWIQCGTVREGYDLWAPLYDHDGNILVALEEPAVAGILGEVAGLEVLDLGCGTGRHALRLAAAGARVTALDFSEGMLDEARRKAGAEGVAFRVHDLARPLPFPASAFDRVVSGLVLEHLEDPGRFFSEARRVLRPGGRAVVSAMHPSMFLRGKMAHFSDPATGMEVRPGSLPHGVGDLVMAALDAGFRPAGIRETAPDDQFINLHPGAAKYLGWPMLLVLDLEA